MPGVGLEPTMPRRAAPFKGAGCAGSPTRATSGIHAHGQAPLHPREHRRRARSPASSRKKVFDQLWGLVDEDEPPELKHRDIDWRKLLLAAAVQGAIFRAVQGGVGPLQPARLRPHTGTWPGEERPKRVVTRFCKAAMARKQR